MTAYTLLTPDEKRAYLQEARRRGGLVRAQSFSSEFQRMARSHVSHESNVANGRKGGIAYVRKYGKRKLAENARQYRLVHPSDLERIVEDALHLVGACDYEREGYIFPDSHVHHITGDFVFRKSKRVVYADGAAWHNGKALHPSLADCAERGVKDARYDEYMRARGWRVLRLTEAEIREYDRQADSGIRGDEPMLRKLRDFLRVGG